MRSKTRQVSEMVRGGRAVVVLLLLLSGCPVAPPSGGEGTIKGTVTNSTTGAAIESVAVTLDPAVPGIEGETGANGSFSANVPAGSYSLTFSDPRYETATAGATVVEGQTVTVDVNMVPAAPVYISAKTDGDETPGAALTASATVEILDGSTTVQGYSWTQTGGAAVSINNKNSSTSAVNLPDATAFKEQLIHVLDEPPVTADDLPPNVPLPEGEFPGGLQDRFYIVGTNPFALEHAGHVVLTVTVTTSSGTFVENLDIHVDLPFKPTGGIANVPVDLPVILHGKTRDGDYDWEISGPGGVELIDAASQNPHFTPTESGLYTVTVSDPGNDPDTVTLEIYAGEWEGAVTGQNADGRPEADGCTLCHNGVIAADTFTSWAETGHAEIFTDNLNTSTHYGEGCFACHTVGFDPTVQNGGFDDASDYHSFLDAGLLNNPGDNWTTTLDSFPDTAMRANIQCENCHGPQGSDAHTNTTSRVTLSSDGCAVCHGEPLRHARFQQWQLSGHANYELAVDEGTSSSCARCHTANGFLAWLPVLLDDDPATDPLDDVAVTWSASDVHPQTCVTCHDPHSIGTTTGVDTNATTRISGDTPPLIAGFSVTGAGKGAICMTCHNSRRGLRNDTVFDGTDLARAPHGSAQTDVLMGQNAYFVNTGVRGGHSFILDTCVNCHMEKTPPPAQLSYNQGGTNHTFFASPDICADCHGESLTAETVQGAFEADLAILDGLIRTAIENLMSDLIADGNSIDVGGEATITNANTISEIEFGETHGRQGISVTLTDGTVTGIIRLPDVRVLSATNADVGELYDHADDRLAKSGWNYILAHNDGSKGVHNPSYVTEFVNAAITQLQALNAE